MLATTAAEFGASGTVAGSLVFQGPQLENPLDGCHQCPEAAAPLVAVAVPVAVAVAVGACAASPSPRAKAAAPHAVAREIRWIKFQPSRQWLAPMRHWV